MEMSNHRDPVGPPGVPPGEPAWPGQPAPDKPMPDTDTPPFDPERIPGTPQGPNPASPDGVDIA